MSDIVSFSAAAMRKRALPKMRIGLLRLSDAAPVIAAQEFGFFAEEGVEVELFVEPSWANIADKLAFGFLDAAVIVPPLAFAVDLGLRGAAQKLIIPYTISQGGNTVTLAKDLARKTRDCAAREKLPVVRALAWHIREKPVTLGIVHAYSTHNLLLRYWLATAGILAGRDLKLTVVPPARAVEALQAGQIDGFCAGAPWGEVAARAGVGATIATSNDIWQSAPEKAFAVRAHWVQDWPGVLEGVLRALLRAAQFCDAAENASYTAALLAQRKYLDVESHAILASLPGGAIAPDNVSVFFRNAATFPWRSQAQWFLQEMARWGLLAGDIDMKALAGRVYRPDIYRAAAASLGIPAPLADSKKEGVHSRDWVLDAMPAPLAMSADSFCDGEIFDPESPPSRMCALHNL